MYRTTLHAQFEIDPGIWVRVLAHADEHYPEDHCFTVQSNLLNCDLAQISPAYRLAVETIQNLIRCQATAGVNIMVPEYELALRDTIHDLRYSAEYDLREGDTKRRRRSAKS